MAFDHVDVDRLGPGLTPEDIDQRMTTIRFDVDGSEVVEPLGSSLVDFDPLRTLGLDDVAKWRKGLARQWCRKQLKRIQSQSVCDNGPKTRNRLMPPSGNMFSRI